MRLLYVALGSTQQIWGDVSENRGPPQTQRTCSFTQGSLVSASKYCRRSMALSIHHTTASATVSAVKRNSHSVVLLTSVKVTFENFSACTDRLATPTYSIYAATMNNYFASLDFVARCRYLAKLELLDRGEIWAICQSWHGWFGFKPTQLLTISGCDEESL